MQSENANNTMRGEKRPLVIRSLRRSNIRKRVAEYLFDISPSGSYTSEIAYHIKTTPTNVIGAIRGMQSRYREDESLIGLDMVELVSSGKDMKVYKLTDFGKEILESLNSSRKRLWFQSFFLSFKNLIQFLFKKILTVFCFSQTL